MKELRSILMFLTSCVIVWLTIFGTSESYVPQSIMGEGFCLPDEPTYNLEISGPRMCLFACYRNELCRSVNYIRDLLQCLFVSTDSDSFEDFDSTPECIHYTSPSLPANASNTRCNGNDCPDYHSCVTLSQGNVFCLRTECPSATITNGVIGPGNNRVGAARSADCLTDYEYEDEQLTTVITCRPDGTWTKDSLFCRLQKCPQPTVPSNAAILPGNITIGSLRYIECLAGYAQIGGEDYIECQSGKIWTSWTGQCSLCSEPAAIPNSVISSGGLTVGTQRTYSCVQDYQSNGATANITCQDDAQWSATSFACSLAECAEPTTPPPNAVILAGSNEVGSSRTISCQTGYAMTGSQTTIVCQSGQIWSSWSGSCITCNEPDIIAGATISSGSLTVGSTRTYSCNPGFGSNGQSATITCESGATWSQTSFACVAVCPAPPTLTNAIVQSGDNGVGSRRTISCVTGYALIGQTYIECQASQQWTTWTGSCSTCNTPNTISSATISSGAVTVGSQRTYSCNTGYQNNGQSGVITCQSDATWSATSFSCSITDCGTPSAVSNAAVAAGSTTWNSVATYTCNHGFQSNGGTTTTTCQSSGSWTSVSLYCSRVSTATISFESSDTYNFINSGAQFGWTKISGSTSSTSTGPTGAYHGSYYRYFETSSPTTFGSRARMITDVYFDNAAKCIDFYYNMYGTEIGTLYLKYVLEGSSTEYTQWSESGNKGTTSWFNAKVAINVNLPFKVIFEATDGGNDFYGDVAVDYIRIKTYC